MTDPDNAESAVPDALSDVDTGEYLSFSNLEGHATIGADDIEEVLTRLQEARRVEYSGRHGGYKLTAVPDHETCAVCGDVIERGAHYRLRDEPRGPADTSTQSFSLHTRCATALTSGLEHPEA
jgi:hypothetical protein